MWPPSPTPCPCPQDPFQLGTKKLVHISWLDNQPIYGFSQNVLCNPMDCSPPGSSVHGILQARILEWVAMPSSRGSSRPGIELTSPESLALKADSLPRILEWVAISFSRGSSQPGIELTSPESLALQADSLPTEPLGKPTRRF